MDQERLARELAEAMCASLSEAAVVVKGSGTQCRVVASGRDRACVVSCFWYGPVEGLVLGMSANNAHLGAVRGGLPRKPRTGAEYLIVLHEGQQRVAGGRTHTIADVICCVRAWTLDRRPIEAMYEPFPYIDRTRRAMARVAARIEARLRPVPPVRVAIEQDLGYELWAYGDGRSCRVDLGDEAAGGACACAFLVVQSQAARVVLPEPEIAGAVAAWTQERATLDELRRGAPGLVLEPHGELLEAGQVARWHWLHVLELARAPDSGLHAYRPLIERILERPAVAGFFSFTSLDRLCFSSSSNYPFVTDGLPILWAAGDGTYVVQLGGERQAVDLERALALIEAALEAAPHRPFHGSEAHLIGREVDAELRRRGSGLQVALRQARQWYRVELRHGRRTCELGSLDSACFCEEPAGEAGSARFPDLGSMVRAARRWLEDAASPEEMRAELASWKPPDPRRWSFDPD
jgi:hypothetical protein